MGGFWLEETIMKMCLIHVFALKEHKWKCPFKAEVTLEVDWVVWKQVGCSNVDILNDFMRVCLFQIATLDGFVIILYLIFWMYNYRSI